MLEQIKYKRKTNGVEIFLSKDKKGKPVIYVGNENKTIHLKKFLGDWDYKKFLTEAVILRLTCDKGSARKARDIYCMICDTLNDENKNTFNDE
jgi:hypothetical protein